MIGRGTPPAVTEMWRQILAGSSGTLSTASNTRDERYLLLPPGGGSSKAVSCRSRQAFTDVIARSGKAGWLPKPILAGVAGLTNSLDRVLPSCSVTNAAGPTLRGHLSDLLGSEVEISISLGPPRVNRKPVISCYAGDRLVAVAKLGLEAHTAAMIRNEASWLSRLQESPIPGVQTPRTRTIDVFDDKPLLVMDAFPDDVEAFASIDSMPDELLTTIAALEVDDTKRLETSPWWTALPDRLDRSHDTLYAQVADEIEDSDIATTFWHGDWSPYNVGHDAAGDIWIWDWERAGTGVPAGFDALHLFEHYGPGAEAAGRLLELVGVPTSRQATHRRLYSLELAARHAEANRSRIGAPQADSGGSQR